MSIVASAFAFVAALFRLLFSDLLAIVEESRLFATYQGEEPLPPHCVLGNLGFEVIKSAAGTPGLLGGGARARGKRFAIVPPVEAVEEVFGETNSALNILFAFSVVAAAGERRDLLWIMRILQEYSEGFRRAIEG